MNTLKLAALIIVLFCYYIQVNGQTNINGGPVAGVWTLLGSPYLIYGNIEILEDSILEVEPGVLVEFQGHYEINVHGVLLAEGTEKDTILFTINDTTGFSDLEITLGGWNGINFRNVLPINDTSKIIYCKIEFCKNVASDWPDDSGGAILIENSDEVFISNSVFYSNYANWGGAIAAVNSKLKINNCKFTKSHAKNNGGGIGGSFCTIDIEGSDFINNLSDFQSGAINAWKCDLQINNSNFIGNSSTINYGAIGADSSTVIINNSIFQSNSTIWGGAIASNYGLLEINDSYFSNNKSEHGGAVITGWNQTLINTSDFVQNESVWGGGLSVLNSDLIIDSCLFTKNQAESNAGAIEYIVDSTISKSNHELKITNTKFKENYGFFRGALEIQQRDLLESKVNVDISKCLFLNNSSDRGGVLFINGFIKDFKLSNSILNGNTAVLRTAGCNFSNSVEGIVANCLFSSNITNGGSSAAAIGTGSKVSFENCTFTQNSGNLGASITLRKSGPVTLLNSILWDNRPSNLLVNALDDSAGCELNVYYSSIQDGADSIRINDTTSILNWGIGNIDADPLFSIADSFYRLTQNSPCIGTGIESIEIEGVWHHCSPTDLLGSLRPNPVDEFVDMGAIESEFLLVGIERNGKKTPKSYVLFQNYPNPFNPSTTIKYSIPASVMPNSFQHQNNEIPDQGRNDNMKVQLNIYDLLGSEVSTLVNKEQPPGNYEIEFDGSELTSGIYFYRLQAGDPASSAGQVYVDIKKMILLK
jgi:Secretion system C-terminal sorting domain